MKYMGSKSRISKYIVPILQSCIDENELDTYVEPFVGGANVIDKIQCDKRIGYDNNKYLIALLSNLDRLENLPKDLSKEHYLEVKESWKNENYENYDLFYIGAIGFLGSYNGKFFDGYAGKTKTKIGTTRDYYDESKRNIEKQIDSLSDVVFENLQFNDYIVKENGGVN